MPLSSIGLIVFLALFGAIQAFGLHFQYEGLIVGLIAIATAILMAFRR